jgi:hypothetical protein
MADVTRAALLFADGSEVAIDFVSGNQIDDALAKLRLASTGDARPSPPVADDEVETMRKALIAEIARQSDGMWPQCDGDLVDMEIDFDELARAALAASDREVLVAENERLWEEVRSLSRPHPSG